MSSGFYANVSQVGGHIEAPLNALETKNRATDQVGSPGCVFATNPARSAQVPNAMPAEVSR